MKKILIADHDYAVRLLYQMELEDEGYQVTTTDDFMGLVDHANRIRPDLILFDVSSGESRELEVYSKLRSELHGMPIVLSSTYDSALREVTTAATNASFVKTIDLDKLKTIVRTIFERTSGIGESISSQNEQQHPSEFPHPFSIFENGLCDGIFS